MNISSIGVLVLLLSLFLWGPQTQASVRSETLLEKGWKFARGEQFGAEFSLFDDSSWKNVAVPHDWAIDGPFSEFEDRQGGGDSAGHALTSIPGNVRCLSSMGR